MDALAIDAAFRLEQCPNPAIAIARMLLSKLGDIRKYGLLVWTRARSVVECGTLQLCQQAGASHRDAFGRQETHRITLLGDGHGFFASNSLSASTSRSRSASSRLRRAFSFSNSLSRWTSLSD